MGEIFCLRVAQVWLATGNDSWRVIGASGIMLFSGVEVRDGMDGGFEMPKLIITFPRSMLTKLNRFSPPRVISTGTLNPYRSHH